MTEIKIKIELEQRDFIAHAIQNFLKADDIKELTDKEFSEKYHFSKADYFEEVTEILKRLQEYKYIHEDFTGQKVAEWEYYKVGQYVKTVQELRENLGLKAQGHNLIIKNALWNAIRKLNRKLEKKGVKE